MFVIRRTDQGGGYVATSGSKSSYTHDLRLAQTYSTRSLADQNRCPGNEVVEDIRDILQSPL